MQSMDDDFHVVETIEIVDVAPEMLFESGSANEIEMQLDDPVPQVGGGQSSDGSRHAKACIYQWCATCNAEPNDVTPRRRKSRSNSATKVTKSSPKKTRKSRGSAQKTPGRPNMPSLRARTPASARASPGRAAKFECILKLEQMYSRRSRKSYTRRSSSGKKGNRLSWNTVDMETSEFFRPLECDVDVSGEEAGTVVTGTSSPENIGASAVEGSCPGGTGAQEVDDDLGPSPAMEPDVSAQNPERITGAVASTPGTVPEQPIDRRTSVAESNQEDTRDSSSPPGTLPEQPIDRRALVAEPYEEDTHDAPSPSTPGTVPKQPIDRGASIAEPNEVDSHDSPSTPGAVPEQPIDRGASAAGQPIDRGASAAEQPEDRGSSAEQPIDRRASAEQPKDRGASVAEPDEEEGTYDDSDDELDVVITKEKSKNPVVEESWQQLQNLVKPPKYYRLAQCVGQLLASAVQEKVAVRGTTVVKTEPPEDEESSSLDTSGTEASSALANIGADYAEPQPPAVPAPFGRNSATSQAITVNVVLDPTVRSRTDVSNPVCRQSSSSYSAGTYNRGLIEPLLDSVGGNRSRGRRSHRRRSFGGHVPAANRPRSEEERVEMTLPECLLHTGVSPAQEMNGFGPADDLYADVDPGTGQAAVQQVNLHPMETVSCRQLLYQSGNSGRGLVGANANSLNSVPIPSQNGNIGSPAVRPSAMPIRAAGPAYFGGMPSENSNPAVVVSSGATSQTCATEASCQTAGGFVGPAAQFSLPSSPQPTVFPYHVPSDFSFPYSFVSIPVHPPMTYTTRLANPSAAVPIVCPRLAGNPPGSSFLQQVHVPPFCPANGSNQFAASNNNVGLAPCQNATPRTSGC